MWLAGAADLCISQPLRTLLFLIFSTINFHYTTTPLDHANLFIHTDGPWTPPAAGIQQTRVGSCLEQLFRSCVFLSLPGVPRCHPPAVPSSCHGGATAKAVEMMFSCKSGTAKLSKLILGPLECYLPRGEIISRWFSFCFPGLCIQWSEGWKISEGFGGSE